MLVTNDKDILVFCVDVSIEFSYSDVSDCGVVGIRAIGYLLGNWMVNISEFWGMVMSSVSMFWKIICDIWCTEGRENW